MARLIISTASGTADPTRASLPFHIAANGAIAAGVEVAVILAGDATDLVKPGLAESVRGVGVPPLAELLEKCRAGGVTLHV
jgi:predicted peroxiredoxin